MAQVDGEPVVEWLVGDPQKATTSRRTVENSIRRFLDERQEAAGRANTDIRGRSKRSRSSRTGRIQR